MPKFKVRPGEIEAVQFTGENWDEMGRFVGFHKSESTGDDIQNFNKAGTYMPPSEVIEAHGELWLPHMGCWLSVIGGDWILKFPNGNLGVIADEEFDDNYIPVNTSSNLVEIGPEAFADLELTVISYKGENYYSEDFKKEDPEEFFYHDSNTMDKVYGALDLVGLDQELQAILMEEFAKNGLLIRELRSEADISEED